MIKAKFNHFDTLCFLIMCLKIDNSRLIECRSKWILTLDITERKYEEKQLTVALDIVINEVASVGALVGPGEASVTMLASLNVVTFVGGAIGPRFETLPMLFVFLPVTTVLSTV